MKRKILVHVSSWNPNGNTYRFAEAFIKGCKDAGHEVKVLFSGKASIEGCRGCGACQVNETHKCAIQDDMQKAYPMFEWCDTLVLASPLYFWTFSSKTKAFFDRLYAVSENDRYPYKETYLLMTADSDGENTFQLPVNYYQFITQALGWKNLGMCLGGGCSGDRKGHSISEENLKKAYEAGLDLSEIR